MKILFVCHNHPYHAFGDRPRGGELSVRIIMQHLRQRGHEVRAFFGLMGAKDEYEGIQFHHGDVSHWIGWADVVLTWGRPASATAQICQDTGTPYVLMVRWWRNVCPLPPGNVMYREIPQSFKRTRRALFENATAIITNNYYAAAAIQRQYGVDAYVSYVPILGEADPVANESGYLLMISPDKDLGEFPVARDIMKSMSDQKLLVVNPGKLSPLFARLPRTTVFDYVQDMRTIWQQTKILLLPVYHNDVCGTTRAAIEAMQHGVPVIANDRNGMGEKVPNLVAYNAGRREWCEKIASIEADYEKHSAEAVRIFREYNTQAQLEIYDYAIGRI